MKKREPSPAFVAARALAKQIAAMSTEQKEAFVANFPAVVTIEGHALSPHNAAMAITQRKGATIVGGFKQWLAAGRCVSKGSTALWIYAPSKSKQTDAATGDESESIFFRLVPVFDVSQTEEANSEQKAA